MSNNRTPGGLNGPAFGKRAASSASRLSDQMLYCERCGISFLWTVEEQEREIEAAAGAHLVAPRNCPGCRALLPAPERERGMVKWYNIRKRYGFVVRVNQPDIFVPSVSLQGVRFLQTGDLVEFTVSSNSEGPMAADVRLLAHSTA